MLKQLRNLKTKLSISNLEQLLINKISRKNSLKNDLFLTRFFFKVVRLSVRIIYLQHYIF